MCMNYFCYLKASKVHFYFDPTHRKECQLLLTVFTLVRQILYVIYTSVFKNKQASHVVKKYLLFSRTLLLVLVPRSSIPHDLKMAQGLVKSAMILQAKSCFVNY